MEIENQINKVIKNLEGLSLKEWEAIKKFIDIEFRVLNKKNTLILDESILKNITSEINW